MRRQPHVRLPDKVDRILYLLSEEIKSNKFFNALSDAGLDDDGNGRVCLQYLILEIIFKLEAVPDELGEMYLKLLEKHSRKIGKDYGQEELNERALKFYIDLIFEKKKRKK